MAPINSLCLTGRCISPIKLDKSRNNRDYCNFDFEFLTLIKDENGQFKTGIIPTVTFGPLAKLIHANLKMNEKITIIGSLDYSAEFNKLSIIINDIEFCLKNYFPKNINQETVIPRSIPIIPNQIMDSNPFKNADS